MRPNNILLYRQYLACDIMASCDTFTTTNCVTLLRTLLPISAGTPIFGLENQKWFLYILFQFDTRQTRGKLSAYSLQPQLVANHTLKCVSFPATPPSLNVHQKHDQHRTRKKNWTLLLLRRPRESFGRAHHYVHVHF